MIEVQKFKAEHGRKLLELDRYAGMRPLFSDERLAGLEAPHSNAMTILFDGNPLLVGGAAEYWPERAEIWAMMHPDCSKHAMRVHKIVKRYLSLLTVRRLEASVEVGFEKGRRWIAALGFKLEAERLEAYLPNGKDCALYARVRHV